MILPWQQWTHHGKVPYVDIVPIHGGLSLVRGMISEYFFDGTSIGATYADHVLFAAAGATAFLAAWAVGGPAPALMLLLSGEVLDRLLFFFPGMFLLCIPSLLRRPLAWLATWLGVCLLTVAYNHTSGVVLALASSLIAAVQLFRALAVRPRTATCVGMGGAALVLLALMLTPLGAVARGFLQFIGEFNKHYDLAGGMASGLVFAAPASPDMPIGSRFGHELFRYTWALMIPVAIGVGWARRRSSRPSRNGSLMCLGLLYVITTLLLT